MAHNIMEIDLQQGTEQAWHGLTQVKADISLQNNWLRDWECIELPLNFANGKETPWKVLGCSDLPDTYIGAPYNPATFRPVFNAEFLQMIEDAVSGTEHKLVSVGSIRSRGRVFVSFELRGKEKFSVNGQQYSAFLNFGNGHDKSSVLWGNTSNTKSVCDNTFTMNLFETVLGENKNESKTEASIKFSSRHTKNVKLKLPEFSKLIDKAIGVQAEFAKAMESLAIQPIAVDNARELFAGFVTRNNGADELSTRAENTVEKMVELFARGKGNSGETLRDAFDGVTDYYSHFSSGGENRMKQFVSSEFGAANIAKQDFYRIIQLPEKRGELIAKGRELLAAN